MAGSQWSLSPLPTHKGTAPFLHVGALAAITALSWIVAGQFARAERSCKYPNRLVLPSLGPHLDGLGIRCRSQRWGFHRGLQPRSALHVSSSVHLSVWEFEVKLTFPATMGAARGAESPQSIWVLTGGGKRGPAPPHPQPAKGSWVGIWEPQGSPGSLTHGPCLQPPRWPFSVPSSPWCLPSTWRLSPSPLPASWTKRTWAPSQPSSATAAPPW